MDAENQELASNMLFFQDVESFKTMESERSPMTVQCCMCKRVREQQRWVDPGFNTVDITDISHGYCPVCAAKAFAEIRAYSAQKCQDTRKAASF